MGNKGFPCQPTPYLEVCPQTLCPRVAETKFVHAQVHATGEKCSLRDYSCGLSRKEQKSESTHLLCSIDGIIQQTRMSCLSQFTTSRTGWRVLACEAHPESSAKCVETNSVYCSTEAGDSMARTPGHRGDSEEFALQVWCEQLRETYEHFSICPPRSTNGVAFHAWRHVL